jgi:rubrerythrin
VVSLCCNAECEIASRSRFRGVVEIDDTGWRCPVCGHIFHVWVKKPENKLEVRDDQTFSL